MDGKQILGDMPIYGGTHEDGITLRQHYAGLLLAASVAAGTDYLKASLSMARQKGMTLEDCLALGAVQMADALCAAISQEPQP